MTQRFNLENYVTVNERIQEFWKKYPEGRIETDVHHLDGADTKSRMVVIKAEVYSSRDAMSPPIATGYAKEREGTQGANTTAFLENCETSAIGRALANLGLLTEKGRPSSEEMQAVENTLNAHADALGKLKTLGAMLPEGHELKKTIRASWTEMQTNVPLTFKMLFEVESLTTKQEK